MCLLCRIGRLVSTPLTSPFAKRNVAFGRKRHVRPIRYSRLLLADWLSSGRVTLHDPSNRAFFRNPGDLWLADHFKGDSFPLASTLSEQLFHRQMLLLAATLVAISLLGKRLNLTNKRLCLLLRVVSKGKCLSHRRCTTPCIDPMSIATFPLWPCSSRFCTCRL